MSWLNSRALVAAYSGGNFLDGEQSAPLNVMPTQHKFWRNDKMMDASNLSRFGLTCAVLEPTTQTAQTLLKRYAQSLMTSLSQAAFPAKTSASPVKAQASTANDQGCGVRWRELFVRYDLATCSWRTHRHLFDEDLPESSVILPKWGMLVDGELSERTTPEHLTKEKESGLWPTPCLPGNGGSHGKAKMKAMLWQTPTCSRGDYQNSHGKKSLKLSGAVKTWPTPTAHNAKECDSPAEATRNTPTLTAQARGGDLTQPRRLNPIGSSG